MEIHSIKIINESMDIHSINAKDKPLIFWHRKKKIPKIIHQMHTLGMDYVNNLEREAIAILKRNNPDWEYRFYGPNEIMFFLMTHYSERYINAYYKINPEYGAARSDYFRYLLINKVGGVYLDVKSYTLVPFNDIINCEDELILFGWQEHPTNKYSNYGSHQEITRINEYQQWNIFSTPGNKYIKNVVESITTNIENYTTEEFQMGWRGVFRTTGPIAYTNAIESVNDGVGIRFAGNHEVNGLIYKIEGDINSDEKQQPKHYTLLDTPVILDEV